MAKAMGSSLLLAPSPCPHTHTLTLQEPKTQLGVFLGWPAHSQARPSLAQIVFTFS